jgi:hypothetical protein
MTKTTTERRQTKVRGYEDSDILEILAQVMLDKPELSATAAIKSLGIIDTPSIRRLRDKYQGDAQRRGQLATAAGNGRVITFPGGPSMAPAVIAPSPPAATPTVPAVSATADSPETRKRIRDDMAAANLPSAPFAAAAALPDSFFETSGAGMKAWVSALEMQQVMWFEMMRTLPMAAALRNQMVFCEWTMAAYRRAPKTIKD